jgi:Tfp pilus assembly protein PilF
MEGNICVRRSSVALIAAALFSLASVCSAQETRAGAARANAEGFLTGEVESDTPGPIQAGLMVELVSSQDHWSVQREPVSLTGGFQIDGIAPGDYELQVVDGAHNVIQSQSVHIAPSGNAVRIRLPDIKRERPPTGTVSASRLQRKIPSKAVKEFQKAQDASRAGQTDKSIEHLKKAIEIEPAYAEAYNNLGVQYLKLNRLELAGGQFQKATELDNTLSPAFCNLSVVLYNLGRIPEAERAARDALKTDSTSSRARMMLGLILISDSTRQDEALENILVAEREFPKMHLAAAEILARRGQRKKAAEELRRYLEAGPAENRQQVETWIASLEQAPPLQH